MSTRCAHRDVVSYALADISMMITSWGGTKSSSSSAAGDRCARVGDAVTVPGWPSGKTASDAGDDVDSMEAGRSIQSERGVWRTLQVSPDVVPESLESNVPGRGDALGAVR